VSPENKNIGGTPAKEITKKKKEKGAVSAL
jgi:hypothetical protein